MSGYSPSELIQSERRNMDSFSQNTAQLRTGFGLLSPAELAALVDKDERTLAVWRCQKRGPDFVKLGRTVFYRKEDVMDWISLNTVATDRAAS
jgi:hypothetical protein